MLLLAVPRRLFCSFVILDVLCSYVLIDLFDIKKIIGKNKS